jgi:hypothetical protein
MVRTSKTMERGIRMLVMAFPLTAAYATQPQPLPKHGKRSEHFAV